MRGSAVGLLDRVKLKENIFSIDETEDDNRNVSSPDWQRFLDNFELMSIEVNLDALK
jgi:hypothetical protein